MKLLFIGLLSFFILGCSSAQKVTDGNVTKVAEESTADEHEVLGIQIEDSLNANTDFFESRFNYVVFIKKIYPEIEKSTLEEVVRQFKENKTARSALQTGSYTFFRSVTFEERTYLFYRLIYEDATFLYFGLELNEKQSGTFDDIYYFSLGSPLSERVQGVKEIDLSIWDRKKLNVSLKRLGTQPEQSLEIWQSLPERARKVRFIQEAYLRALSNSSLTVEYEERFYKYQELYPNDPATLFLAFDFYFSMKRFPDFYDTIDSIEEYFGRDPYLDMVRAGGLSEEGRFEEAYLLVKRCINEEPSISEAWLSALELSVVLKKYSETKEVFEVLVKEFGSEWHLDALTADATYKEFFKSKEGIEVLKMLEKNQNETSDSKTSEAK